MDVDIALDNCLGKAFSETVNRYEARAATGNAVAFDVLPPESVHFLRALLKWMLLQILGEARATVAIGRPCLEES